MSSIGVATSMFISILVMTVMIFMGKWILSALPDPVVAALPMLLPALFGALLAQQLMNHPRLGAAAVALAAAVRLGPDSGNIWNSALWRRICADVDLRVWNHWSGQNHVQNGLAERR